MYVNVPAATVFAPRFLLRCLACFVCFAGADFSLAQLSEGPVGAASVLEATIDFDREVRPILSNHCFKCHGPDEQQLQAGLRMDLEGSIFGAADSGAIAIVPGQPNESEVMRRILSRDEDQRMPPPAEGKDLSEAQVMILTRWIEQGAKWSDHWAFEPVDSPAVPQVDPALGTVANPIDAFVLQRLAAVGLEQAPLETKARLLRRLSLDLTGLPPTVADVDAFENDESADAYEKVVERLLGSQHFGERLAVPWLDLARYGDTSGYHNDSLRDMWLWREWVIHAFNSNMPFDQFTKQQLAGDLIPESTIQQQIASGFHRNVMTSDEGGLIDAEYRNLYVVDRVATTGVTWLGLTVACAQCHDHKYDPITQADFYKLYAFFNNVPENGKDGVRDRNPKPFLRVPTAEDQIKLAAFDADIAAADAQLSQINGSLAERQTQWEATFALSEPTAGMPEPFVLFEFEDAATGVRSGDSADLAADAQGDVQYTKGAVGKAFETKGNAWFEYGEPFGFSKDSAFSVSAYLSVAPGGGSPFGKMDDPNGARGWDVEFHGLRPSVHLIHKWPNDAIHIQAEQDLPANTFTHLTITYDGSGKAAGLKLYVNGSLAKTNIKIDSLKGEITNSVPFSIGRRGPSSTNFNGAIDDVRVYQRELSDAEVASLNTAEARAIVNVPLAERSDQQKNSLSEYFQRTQIPELAMLKTKIADLRKTKVEFENALPNTMVMSEMDKPRDTFIKVRGNYDLDGEQVSAAAPGFLPQISNADSRNLNRLDLANWLMSSEHPLTARVAVNRWWAILFGNGLVKTLNDFGLQGERPSHPELLDWLAADFMRDWDIKRAIKQIVTSRTYQQSAQASPELVQLDSENRLLARGPRQRLDAEFLRDNALAIGGVLNPAIGGRSIKPAQPAGTWEINEMSGYAYEKSKGEDLYRRGLYVYWRRSTVYPSFVTLDAPTREFCVSQRAKTSTPLQSLVLMNDPVFVEAARAMAQRILTQPNLTEDDRVELAWRLALSRKPSASETHILTRTLKQQLDNYRADPDAAQKLVSVGDLARPESIDVAELAAWTALSNVILNLNETITN
jgi:hypothetical protein